MADTKIAAEARAVLEEAERADPAAHGYSAEVLRDLGELLQASAGFVILKGQADRAQELVVRLARRVTKNAALTDEEAIREAGALAIRLLKPAPKASTT